MLCIPAGHSLECFLIFFSVKTQTWFFFTIMTRVGENTTMIPQSQPTRNAVILYYYYYFLRFYFSFFPASARVFSATFLHRMNTILTNYHFLPVSPLFDGQAAAETGNKTNDVTSPKRAVCLQRTCCVYGVFSPTRF